MYSICMHAAAMHWTMPEGAELEIARIDDLPLINPDLEETVEGGATRFPPSVERLRQQVAAADAIFFATPEYNYSMPAPLKNAIDWVSRPLPKNEWAQKPTAIATIAGGFSGMLGRQAICVAADFVDLLILQKPAFFYNQWGPGGPPFNGAGEPTAEVSKRLGALMVALIDWTHRLEQK
mmetsp:Transcript_15100/g.45602  ORF Transcript_15100/g.45602 Transcript_15100/m.45602 type:complete len:179 (-) Transcript_15100:725-1261(-)